MSRYIGAKPFLWLAVPDRESRSRLERNLIALLSSRSGGVDTPSAQWLGLSADSEKVRASGLWNVNHVDDAYETAFLSAFRGLVPR